LPITSRTSRYAFIAALAGGVGLAAPVLILRYPPMGDLPFHESLVSLLRHFGDGSWEPDGIYALNLGEPNQLFHLAAYILSLFVHTDTACKLLVAMAIAATPVGAARLAQRRGTTPWCALLVAPLSLGFAFRWGLVGNVLALPLLLWVLPALDVAADDPSWRATARACGLIVLLYLAHESALVVGVAATILFAIHPALRDGGKRAVQRALPAALGLGLAAYYSVRSRHVKAPSILVVRDEFGAGPVARLIDVPKVVFGNLEPWTVASVFALLAIAFVPFVMARVEASREQGRSSSWLDFLHRHRLGALSGACFVAYLAMPLAFSGSTLLYQRFLATGLALLAVAVAPPSDWPMRPIAHSLPPSAALATLFVSLPAFGDADRRFKELDGVLPTIVQGSAVAQLDLTPARGGAVAPIPGAAARALAERGGRLLFSFTDAPTSPVVMRPAHQWNEPVLRLARDPYAFSPPHDFTRFRYALVRLAPEWHQLAPSLVAVMSPEAKLVAASGEWMLFESMLAVVPLTAPEERLATKPAITVRSRLAAIPKPPDL
jgi:hypothetical protein